MGTTALIENEKAGLWQGAMFSPVWLARLVAGGRDLSFARRIPPAFLAFGWSQTCGAAHAVCRSLCATLAAPREDFLVPPGRFFSTLPGADPGLYTTQCSGHVPKPLRIARVRKLAYDRHLWTGDGGRIREDGQVGFAIRQVVEKQGKENKLCNIFGEERDRPIKSAYGGCCEEPAQPRPPSAGMTGRSRLEIAGSTKRPAPSSLGCKR